MSASRIVLSEPMLAGNELAYLRECVESNFVSSAGPFVGRFEDEFAKKTGVRSAVACSSGTAALHVAMRLVGAASGELVAVSDFTFIASANAASYTGADLLLVDSEPQTWNMDTERLYDDVLRRARLGRRIPSVVEVVHVLGHPADIEPVLELRQRFGVRIVEDAAEAHGSRWRSGAVNGRQVGTVGDFGCFSFNGNKLITSGSGGMIVSNDPAAVARARHLVNQAKSGDDGYEHDEVGYNYRMSNLAAAVGLAQLEQLETFLLHKRKMADRYDRLLASAPVVRPPRAEWAVPSHWLYSILLRGEDVSVSGIVRGMQARGIQARRLWPPLHRQRPYLSCQRLGGSVADGIYRAGLSLPSSVGITGGQQGAVVSGLCSLLARHAGGRGSREAEVQC
ncbi:MULTISPECIES: DegT/DnrJ/EryC1/StrS family aminotransferase [Amycolatopsis]|uniref:DegT/DnrJ/EryC1/StrS family aminotransferase n=1 Tax=Amycolatopsis thermalba TaxID=944492 RepID=A0ABY4NQ87_9PSEU|nr:MULTISPECIES: DegT/DnrJ/EryC1/StrS family aminotransferase [Amycolatopsis]OXM62386.1 DegT/DnrJ/EryC1/StrS aminotransferase [Amycolatopsis sp. KNN50.9b]UQS22101.1 DegT/DnrJ/EryC1/StrS family aminotransferase [Amycolatopsis thermalba]